MIPKSIPAKYFMSTSSSGHQVPKPNYNNRPENSQWDKSAPTIG